MQIKICGLHRIKHSFLINHLPALDLQLPQGRRTYIGDNKSHAVHTFILMTLLVVDSSPSIPSNKEGRITDRHVSPWQPDKVEFFLFGAWMLSS